MSQSELLKIRAAEKLKFLMGLPDVTVRFGGDEVDKVLHIYIEGYPNFLNSEPGQLIAIVTRAKVTSTRGDNHLTLMIGDESTLMGDVMLQRIADFKVNKPVLH